MEVVHHVLAKVCTYSTMFFKPKVTCTLDLGLGFYSTPVWGKTYKDAVFEEKDYKSCPLLQLDSEKTLLTN